MLKTKRRWGTFFRTFPHTHSPNSTTRFWWQEGQKCRRLHENAEDIHGCTLHIGPEQSRFAECHSPNNGRLRTEDRDGKNHKPAQSAPHRPVQSPRNDPQHTGNRQNPRAGEDACIASPRRAESNCDLFSGAELTDSVALLLNRGCPRPCF